MKNNEQTWAEYFRNKNATKNPKTFALAVYRDEQGQFHAIGNQTMILDRSGNKETWTRIDTRDFVRLINKQGINVA